MLITVLSKRPLVSLREWLFEMNKEVESLHVTLFGIVQARGKGGAVGGTHMETITLNVAPEIAGLPHD